MRNELSRAKQAFCVHRDSSERRGIAFLLTFEEWWVIWCDSGHWHERGRKLGQYHMARHGDIGPYAEGNVSIKLGSTNRSEASRGKKLPPRSPEHRAKISAAQIGTKRPPRSQETKDKIRAALLGVKRSKATRLKISESKTGRTINVSKKERRRRSEWLAARNKRPDVRKKISAALKGSTAWKKRKRDSAGHFT